jgi:hypothetical protein
MTAELTKAEAPFGALITVIFLDMSSDLVFLLKFLYLNFNMRTNNCTLLKDRREPEQPYKRRTGALETSSPAV